MEELLAEPAEGRELRAALLPMEALPNELPPLLMLRLAPELLRAALLLGLFARDALLLDFARVVFPFELRVALLRGFGRAELVRALARAVLRDLPRAERALARDFFAPPRDELDFFRLADERLRDDDDRAFLPPLEPFAIGSPF
jgi:hypothetical protein